MDLQMVPLKSRILNTDKEECREREKGGTHPQKRCTKETVNAGKGCPCACCPQGKSSDQRVLFTKPNESQLQVQLKEKTKVALYLKTRRFLKKLIIRLFIRFLSKRTFLPALFHPQVEGCLQLQYYNGKDTKRLVINNVK